MRDNASYYKQFIDVHPGGGVRRNPKRKNVGAYSTPISYLAPTPEEVERVFESHLQQMARGGTYGDNMEITAFSAAYGVDIKIYQRDFAYMISAQDEEEVERQVLHIAYHVSSLRCTPRAEHVNKGANRSRSFGSISRQYATSMDLTPGFLTCKRLMSHLKRRKSTNKS